MRLTGWARRLELVKVNHNNILILKWVLLLASDAGRLADTCWTVLTVLNNMRVKFHFSVNLTSGATHVFPTHGSIFLRRKSETSGCASIVNKRSSYTHVEERGGSWQGRKVCVCVCVNIPALAGQMWMFWHLLRLLRCTEIWWKRAGGRSRPWCQLSPWPC